jgi:UDP-N-acetylmuramyl pentapeptide phosphotransferase/UDP-N-acetylglucosamine-1-phosphate transferase
MVLILVFLSTLFALLFIHRERETFAKRAVRHVKAKQSVHTVPTPRVGGIAIAVGILSGALLSGNDLFGTLLWTTLPIFLIGLLEDLGPDTPPSLRLGVAALSATLAILVLNMHISRVDLPGVDILMSITLIGMAFTIFASTGMTHAINLIDGLNGLSSAVVIAIMITFGLIAQRYGHSDLVVMNGVVCVAFIGFICVNFPNGRVFLGDAGAYSIGHIIAWNAIVLLNREPEISAWGILLVLLWPVLDTLFAMVRRLLTGLSISQPDKLHYHHVLMRLVLLMTHKTIGKKQANPIGSLLSWPLMAIPCYLGYVLVNDTRGALTAIVAFTLAYVVTYHLLIHNAFKLRKALTS